MRDPELQRRARDMRTNPTPAESRLWYHLRAKRFEAVKFRHQTVIGRYIVDFTSRAAMLAIEVDGDTHAEQAAYDATRTRFLEAEGFRVLRFPNSEVMTNLDGVLWSIQQALPKKPSPLQGRGLGEGGRNRVKRLTPSPLSLTLSPQAERGRRRQAARRPVVANARVPPEVLLWHSRRDRRQKAQVDFEQAGRKWVMDSFVTVG